ncbi:MAG: amidohydrolase family protein [bacterium]|nr:amidohydrolase family protein [bacterium]
MDDVRPLVVDAFVNVNMANLPRPAWLEAVANQYFKRPDEIFRNISPGELIDTMDEAGVRTAILTNNCEDIDKHVLSVLDARPDRFVLSAYVNPRNGMAAVRALESFTRDHPVVLARITPFIIDLPANDREYYPIYAKCVELDLPVSILTGTPGPGVYARWQNPTLLDDVCVFFPELTVVMSHGAEPWWPQAISLMNKNPNLYMMTSAWAPKHLPAELIRFMNTRESDRILFASDHPVMPMARCVEEALQLDLRPEARERFLGGNAQRLLLDRLAS